LEFHLPKFSKLGDWEDLPWSKLTTQLQEAHDCFPQNMIYKWSVFHSHLNLHSVTFWIYPEEKVFKATYLGVFARA
jgi:hypothetical protein